MNLNTIHSVYFLGIGGIGMSAIARWFHANGKQVAGYDRTASPLTQKLEAEGITIQYSDDISQIGEAFKDISNTLVVFTPAIKKLGLLNYFQENNFTIKKRAEVLGIITQDHYCIAVAGTHGKTTTSSMVAHLLTGSKKGCSAFVGGIMANTNSNLIIGEANAPVVVEADEFDRSFMQLSPDYIILTSADPDHLDIYGDESSILHTYSDFLNKITDDGKLLISEKANDKLIPKSCVTYGVGEGEIKAKNISLENDCFVFNYKSAKHKIKGLKLQMMGFHNVENALAAITVALDMGMSEEQVREKVASYRGVKRRFEIIHKDEKTLFIDDYAHHPTEIEAFLKSMQSIANGRKVTAIFQPHLFTRTRDFRKGFAKALMLADEVILLEIYPARELPIEGVTSSSILDLMEHDNKKLVSKEHLMEELESRELEIVVTIGAGDIDREVPKIKAFLETKK